MTFTLRTARCAFTRALADLVVYANSISYELAFAEGMDRITEKDPTTDHMKGSLHEIGLAQDIDLYINGIYMPATSDHEPLGTWWEDYGVHNGLPLVWGGNFPTPDGNHYSLRWGGKA
jgi:hypothetical protein